MKREKVHIGVEFPEVAPDIFIEKVIKDLKVTGLDIGVHKRPELGPMNAIEWVIPTAIAAYLFKSYFDGFLKEAGKDHYNVLRNWLKHFIDTGRAIKVNTIYSSKSPSKKNNNNTQSKSVSLILQTKNDKIIKLLFDEDLVKEDWDNAIDQLLDYAIENYEVYPNDKLTSQTDHICHDMQCYIYAIIDKQSKKLLFYGDRDMAQLHYDKSNRQEI